MVIAKRRRPGVSLMEVMIALVIFLGAMVVIGRLIIIGGDRAREVKLESQATQLCQAKLAEVIAGVVPLSSQTGTAFEEAPEWTWSLDAEPDEVQGLWRVQVRVQRQTREEERPVDCTLSQLVIDPSLRGTTDAAPAPGGTEAANSSSTADSSASGGAAAAGGAKGVPSGGGKGPPGGGGKGPPGGGGKGPPGGGGKGPPGDGGKGKGS